LATANLGLSIAQLHLLHSNHFLFSLHHKLSQWQAQDTIPRGERGVPPGGTGTDITIVTRSTHTTTNLVAATSARLHPGDPPTMTATGLQSTLMTKTATTHHGPQITGPEDMGGATGGTTASHGPPRCIEAEMGAGIEILRWTIRKGAIR
jgi:hypothetical protein